MSSNNHYPETINPESINPESNNHKPETINPEPETNKTNIENVPTEADITLVTTQMFDIKKSQESAGLKYKLKYLKAKKDYYYK